MKEHTFNQVETLNHGPDAHKCRTIEAIVAHWLDLYMYGDLVTCSIDFPATNPTLLVGSRLNWLDQGGLIEPVRLVSVLF